MKVAMKVLKGLMVTVVGLLAVLAIWFNTTTCEKIFIFLVGIILFLLFFIFQLKERILKLENYIRKNKDFGR